MPFEDVGFRGMCDYVWRRIFLNVDIFSCETFLSAWCGHSVDTIVLQIA